MTSEQRDQGRGGDRRRFRHGRSDRHEIGRRGHKVAVLDVDAQAAQRVCEDLRADGVTALAVADVSDRAAVEEAFAKVRTEPARCTSWSPVRAGWTSHRSPRSPSSRERLIAVNLTGTFHCLQAAVPDMSRPAGAAW